MLETEHMYTCNVHAYEYIAVCTSLRSFTALTSRQLLLIQIQPGMGSWEHSIVEKGSDKERNQNEMILFSDR